MAFAIAFPISLLFSFYFKVSYQQTTTDNNSNEPLLPQFWHHLYAHYFKKIEF